MAQISPQSGCRQERVQCSICFHVYDLEKHLPKGLPCLHTVCEACVDNFKKGLANIKCPICKQDADLSKIITNFGLCDIVEKICQSCGSRENGEKCPHCDKDVCSICADEHAKVFHGQVKAELQLLRQKIKEATVQSLDDSVLEAERKRGDESIREIKLSMDYHLKEYIKLDKVLTMEVEQLQTANIEQYTRWGRELDAKLDQSKPFLRQSVDTIGREHSADCLVTEIARIHNETVKLLTELEDLQQNVPDPVEYKFVPSQPVNITLGEIVTQPEAGDSQLPTYTRYKHARSKAMTGSAGPGPEQFAGAAYVTCMDNRYIVSDIHNHRLKIHDRDLNLMCILGGQGDQDQPFISPGALCTSPGGDLFVIDSFNHRIKVYDRYLQFVRTFGFTESCEDQFHWPRGFAFTSVGNVVICESGNYRVKVHRADGTYLRSIGRRGPGPGEFINSPETVAVTPGDCVLVRVRGAQNLQMFTITGDYVRTITPSVPNSPRAIEIRAVTVDREGNIIIADGDNGRLIVLDAEGRFVCTIGSPGCQPGEMSGPTSVAINNNMDIVVYEWGNHRILIPQRLNNYNYFIYRPKIKA